MKTTSPRLRLPTTITQLSTVFVLACVLTACDNSDVQEQQIDKGIEQIPEEQHSEESAEQPAAETSTPTRRDDGFPWSVPESWTLDETPRQMRIATYMAPTTTGDQEIAVTRFPGRVGGELANINRWRGQMGLAPISETELENSIERFSADDFDGYQLRIESEQGVMLAAAVFDESINQTWFVRATLPNTNRADQLEAELFSMARSITE